MIDAPVEIDVDRLLGEFERLAEFSDAPAPGVTRVLFTETDLAARNYLKGLFSDAGLSVREDPAGNIFARWDVGDKQLPAIATGSHIDAIPHSGRYDGTVGVLGGLEAIRALQRSGLRPSRSIELVVFTAEEPTRFGIGCLGSRLLSGLLSPDEAAALKDAEARSFEEVRREAGCKGSLDAVCLPDDAYHAFVELHIEQGPVLEREGVSIGVVTSIAAPATLRVTFAGSGGHAGAVLMPDRADSLLAAAELALAVERAARETSSVDSVATTGVCNVHPGAVNSIPSRVTLEIDVRDIDQARRDGMLTEIEEAAERIGGARKQQTTVERINADPPATCDPLVITSVEQASSEAGTKHRQMISRAYHDSLFMAQIAPTGMIFIPCRDGVSHRPDEYAKPEDIVAGVCVLGMTLANLCELA